MLRVSGLDFAYGQAVVLRGVSLEVAHGEMVGIIGPNGAGKTTLLRLISGLLRPRQGEIWFGEDRVDRMPPYRVARLGLVHVPEGRHLFPGMSVLENLELGWRVRPDGPFHKRLESVFDLFPTLAQRRRQLAGTLSGGEQQMLAIGRALMAAPKLLLLDEPTLALSPVLAHQIFVSLSALHARDGLTILLVSQEVASTLTMTQRCYVLENGVFVEQGISRELYRNPRIVQAYLGVA
ncbi:MAG: ABC transporter ATP-binding protein [Bacillota bacterium]